MPGQEETKIEAVVREIRRCIREGWYVAHQPLPAEPKLAQALGVSRSTVRVALLRLQADNVVMIVPRAGAFVRSASPRVTLTYPAAQGAGDWAAHLIHATERERRHIQVRMLEPPTIIQIGEERGSKMQLPAEAKMRRRSCLHLVDGVPYRLLERYTPLAEPEARQPPANDSTVPETAPRATCVTEHGSCRMPAASEATLLTIARGQPVIEWERWAWADGRRLIEYTVMIANAALHDWTLTYDPEQRDVDGAASPCTPTGEAAL